LSGTLCDVPASLIAKLKERSGRTDLSPSFLVRSALAEFLNTPLHTLFQVSTSRALVQGTYSGAVTCETLLAHGDFGLGTFEGLDGEMVVVDGAAYRATASGQVTKARGDSAAPFAVVTRFSPTIEQELRSVSSFDDLEKQCDAYRRSDNLFYAFRVDGRFKNIQTRAVSPPKHHGNLLDAAKAQQEFKFGGVEGSLVGIYSPAFSDAFSVPGYHFHFLSNDRTEGGHLLEVSGDALHLQGEELNDFHLVLPENEEFLKVDLSKNVTADLKKAESK
jgi:acetolactate decarboxylase